MATNVLESTELLRPEEFARPIEESRPDIEAAAPKPGEKKPGFSLGNTNTSPMKWLGAFIKNESEKTELMKLAGVPGSTQFQLSMESMMNAMNMLDANSPLGNMLKGVMGFIMPFFKALGYGGDEGLADRMKSFSKVITDLDKGNKTDFMKALHDKVDKGELKVTGNKEKFFKEAENLAEKIYEDGSMGFNEKKALEAKLAASASVTTTPQTTTPTTSTTTPTPIAGPTTTTPMQRTENTNTVAAGNTQHTGNFIEDLKEQLKGYPYLQDMADVAGKVLGNIPSQTPASNNYNEVEATRYFSTAQSGKGPDVWEQFKRAVEPTAPAQQQANLLEKSLSSSEEPRAQALMGARPGG